MRDTRTFLRAVAFLIGITGLLWLLDRIGFSTIGDLFQRVGIQGAAVILGCGLAEALLDGLALRQAALGRVPYFGTLVINQTGAFLNLAAPMEAGEVLKAALLSRHIDGGASTAVLVWNMAARLAKSSVILIAACSALFFLPPFRNRTSVVLGFAVLNLAVYVVFALTLKFGGVGRIFHLLCRLPFFRGRRAERFVAKVQEAERATACFRHDHPGRYAALLAAQAGARTVGLITTWTTLYFMAPGHSLLLGALIFSAMELAGYVVALLPTRVGTMEGSAFLVFEFLGLDGGLGAVLQLTLRLKQLLITSSFFAIGCLMTERK